MLKRFALRQTRSFCRTTESSKLYLGNLSWALRESDLRNDLGRFGEITYLRVMTDQETGRSRGFGFVEFADEQAAQQCMEEMDGAELGGRNIRVNLANQKPN